MKVISVVLNLLGACALAMSGGQPRDLSTAEQFGPLVDASAHRIEVARQVAFAKWDSHRPVEDRQREDEVISAAVAQGEARGLDREFVARFFQAQIDANKFVQYALLSEVASSWECPTAPAVRSFQNDPSGVGYYPVKTHRRISRSPESSPESIL